MTIGLCERIGDGVRGTITLRGHTDDVGPGPYNQDLSQRRAEAVRAMLVRTCPSLSSARVKWSGEDDPVTSNGDNAGRARNRRVDVVVAFDPPDPEQRGSNSADVNGIRPLFAAADKTPERFTVDASKDIHLITKEGWGVRIARGSIVDAQGRAVNGDVVIRCRGFLTSAEAIASGIPMHVGKGPDAGHMESAGMFEVLAFSGGTPLQLREGCDIIIERPLEQLPGAEYNDYMLDPSTGQWEEQIPEVAPVGEAPIMQQVLLGSEIEEGSVTFNDSLAAWWVYKRGRGNAVEPDTLSFSSRRASPDYCMATRCQSARDERDTWKGLVTRIGMTGVIPEIQLRMDRRFFRDHGMLAFRVVVGSSTTHPEWSVFSTDKLWIPQVSLDRKRFISEYVTRHVYQDIDLVASENNGVIRLKSQGTWVEIPVDLSSYRNTPNGDLGWSRQLDSYRKRLANKEKQFNARLRSSNAALAGNSSAQEQDAYNRARRRMRSDELTMEKARWIEACAQREARFQATWQARARAADPMYDDRIKAAEVTARFTMSGFGIYNCDRIMRREGVQAVVDVVDETGAAFPWHTAYAVMDGRTAVITYWGMGKGTGDRMLLSRDMSKLLFVGKDNEVLVVENTARLGRDQQVTLSGNRSAEPRSSEELEALVSR